MIKTSRRLRLSFQFSNLLFPYSIQRLLVLRVNATHHYKAGMLSLLSSLACIKSIELPSNFTS